MRLVVAALALSALAACGVPTGEPLVSAQYPPSAAAFNAPAQTLNSMPPGSANITNSPGATEPNWASFKFRAI